MAAGPGQENVGRRGASGGGQQRTLERRAVSVAPDARGVRRARLVRLDVRTDRVRRVPLRRPMRSAAGRPHERVRPRRRAGPVPPLEPGGRARAVLRTHQAWPVDGVRLGARGHGPHPGAYLREDGGRGVRLPMMEATAGDTDRKRVSGRFPCVHVRVRVWGEGRKRLS